MANYRSESIDKLFKTLMQFDSVEDFYLFFDDVCTINELKDMAQRFEVAAMLEKKINYNTIAAQTGVSTATISRVSRCLNYGDGGYKLALQKLKEIEKDESK